MLGRVKFLVKLLYCICFNEVWMLNKLYIYFKGVLVILFLLCYIYKNLIKWYIKYGFNNFELIVVL